MAFLKYLHLQNHNYKPSLNSLSTRNELSEHVAFADHS